MSGEEGREVAGGGKGPGGGESGGGSYPNPHSGKKPQNDGIMGHGGQTEIDYSGPANPNAPTRDEDDESTEKPVT